MDELSVVRAGMVPYEEARRAQKALELARQSDEIGDVLVLLEHPPVYTKGRRSTADELPMGEDWYRMQGIDVTATDRGGRVTYHGPGQLVAYPIMSLRELAEPDDVHAYIRRMERAIIASLADWGVEARLFDGLTGVWVGEHPPPAGDARKIGSIGIHVNRGSHHPRPGDQRQQRSAALRMGGAVRNRGLPHDLAIARARRRAGPGRVRHHARGTARRLRAQAGRALVGDVVGSLALEPA